MNSSESPDPAEHDSELRALEERLGRLRPAPIPPSSGKGIALQLDALTTSRLHTRKHRRRFATLAIATCLAMGALFWIQQKLKTAPVPESAPESPLLTSSSAPGADSHETMDPELPPFVSLPPIETGIPTDHFVPVSSQQHVRETSDAGVVLVSDRIPARQVRIAYDRAWHWHDPDTETNIRIFQPREDTVLVPLEID